MSEDLAAAYVGLSGPTIRRLMAADDFPKSVALSPGRVAWLRDDLDQWLDARAGRAPALKRGGWDD
jgi:predicted DNA-binding transcriptional regulator AlpA